MRESMEREDIRERLSSQDPSMRRDACEEAAGLESCDLVPELVARLMDEDQGVKEAAINALAAIGGKAVAEAIAPFLRADDAPLRNMAAEILRLVGPEALETISVLLKDADDDVVKFAVDILAEIKDERAVTMLSGLMEHDNSNVRASVVLCLGKIHASGSVQALLKALEDAEDWVRFSAVEGLGYLKDPDAFGPLSGIIEKDSGLIREAAIDAVGKIATSAQAAQVLRIIEAPLKACRIISLSSIVDLLEKANEPGSGFKPSQELNGALFRFFIENLKDSERALQMKALKGLGLLKTGEALEPIFKFANSLEEMDEDTEEALSTTLVSIIGGGSVPAIVREEIRRGGKCFRAVVGALAELRNESAVPVLEPLIDHVAKHELREIVFALESIGSPQSEEILLDCLEKTDGHTRKIAARALSNLMGEAAAPALFKALKKEIYRDVMEEITDVLAVIPSDEVKKEFSSLLSSEKEQLREMGARGLGQIGDESIIEALTIATSDSSPRVRKAAYKSMGRLGIPGTLGHILKGLDDSDREVRLALMKALNGWDWDNIKDVVVTALSDRYIWVRYHAIALVGESCPDNSFEERLLQALLKDEAPVKAAAARALARVGTKKSITVLNKFIEHPDPAVKMAVENAIGNLKC